MLTRSVAVHQLYEIGKDALFVRQRSLLHRLVLRPQVVDMPEKGTDEVERHLGTVYFLARVHI